MRLEWNMRRRQDLPLAGGEGAGDLFALRRCDAQQSGVFWIGARTDQRKAEGF